MTPIEQLAELEVLAKAANAAPIETLRKCNELIEDRIQARIAKGEKERAARSFVLSDRDPLGSRLYLLSCDLSEQIAYQRSVFTG
jgi:hypothetical protein